MSDTSKQDIPSKVPEVTLLFWIMKIAATTLGETGGDAVTMTLDWGYLVGTAIFLSLLVVLVIAQILAKTFRPFLYWATIVASTTIGTTMADFADRSLGIGYTGGSLLLVVCLLAVIGLWYWSQRTISVNTVTTPKVEAFYWATITFSQTLGTALGDWVGPGYSLPTPEMVEAVRMLAQVEGILLDPVYTGKAMAGLIALVRGGTFKAGQRVLFVHTGGAPALYAYQSVLV
jgi:uncharacterized membrane-anchored protein